jgi:hypothetical protein
MVRFEDVMLNEKEILYAEDICIEDKWHIKVYFKNGTAGMFSTFLVSDLNRAINRRELET